MYRCNTKPHFWSQLWLGIIAIFSVSVNAQPTPAQEYRQVYHISQLCEHERVLQQVRTLQAERARPQTQRVQPHFAYFAPLYRAPLHANAPIRAGPHFA